MESLFLAQATQANEEFVKEISSQFTGFDWAVLVAYLAFTTILGHVKKGKQATIRDFFLGGRTLPWQAVCGSIIATEISALTFIGVPGMLFAINGDFTYLQWAIGSIIARFLVGYFLVPLYYEREIYSPYDYMGQRLGERVKKLVSILFVFASILGQSVRVMVTAFILYTVSGLGMEICIILIGIFALIWTLLGGMRTVIWTDVVQFFIFFVGGLFALIWLVSVLGLDSIIEINKSFMIEGVVKNKLRILDTTPPWVNEALGYTLWVGIFAMPFQNLAAFGTDQLNTQRMFCCKSAGDARKAIIWSSFSQVITIMMLCIGASIFAWYQIHEPTPAEQYWFGKDTNFAFPIWIVTILPIGVSGVIVAGAFAAAISSLDSILAALSQTTLTFVFGKDFADETQTQGKSKLFYSRLFVIIWAFTLTSASILLLITYKKNTDSDLIGLAFRLISYVYGPLLGILLLAIVPGKKSFIGIVTGVVLSILITAWTLPDFYNLSEFLFSNWGVKADELQKTLCKPKLNFAWFYPINTFVTFAFGWLFSKFNID